MRQKFRFWHRAQDIARTDHIARAHRRREFPFARAINRRRGDAARDEIAGLVAQNRQRSLHAVEDAAEQSRTQFDLQQRAGRFDRIAHAQTRRVLVHLDGRAVALQANHFADEAQRADAHHLVHLRADETFGDDHGTGDAEDGSWHKSPSSD